MSLYFYSDYIIGYYKMLNVVPVLYSLSFLLIYFVCSSLYLLINFLTIYYYIIIPYIPEQMLTNSRIHV